MSTSHHPAARRSAEEQEALDAALADIFERRIVFNTVLGLKILSVKHGDVRGRIDMRPELVGHYSYGRLHGGVVSATLDAMGGLALLVAIGERHASETAQQVLHRFSKMGTIDLRIDYLRQGIGKHFIATTEVTRLGGRIGSVQMRMVNEEGLLIATGACAYAIG
jgi:uncharacterized protein (TIGR00369 family)